MTAIGVFSWKLYGLGFRAGQAAGNAELVKMYKAGLKATQRRDESIARNLEIYREDIANARRPVRRVYVCGDSELPEAPRRTPGAGGPPDPPRVRQDITATLQACEQGLIQLNALIEVVK